MNTLQYDNDTLETTKLFKQVSRYYIESRRDIQLYRELRLPELEALATNHLNHWKQELHTLIFNSLDCHERLM